MNESEKYQYSDPEKLYKEEAGLINQPFLFPGKNKRAILLIHGWTSLPYEMRRLGKYLNEKEYTVFCPILRGHGTTHEDLLNVKWKDWMSDVSRAYEQLKKEHEKVYVIGTSIGANLSVMLAKSKKEIAGTVLMAMPYFLRLEKTIFILAKILSQFFNYGKKYFPPSLGSRAIITRKVAYQKYPFKSILEVIRLVRITRRELAKIYQPCFIIQSSSDRIVGRKNLERIFSKINSKVKKKKYLKKAYHTFVSDIQNEHVFEDILNFLNEN